MSRKILGIDIQRDAVSAVLIRSGIKGASIEAHEHVPITDPGAYESGLTAALETIVEKMEVSGSVCVASLSADEIFFRNLQVPFKGHKKIKKIISYELEPTLLVSVEDVIVDFIEIDLPDQENHQVIAAAVEKSKLEFILDSLGRFNIKPETVTVGGYPTALYLANRMDTHKNRLFVNIGRRSGSIFIISAGRICLVRSFQIRSEDRSNKIKALCTQIQRTYFAAEGIIGRDFYPDGGWITGCGIDDSGFDKDMAHILGFPVERVSFLNDTDYALQSMQEHPWVPSLMDNALSLVRLEIEGINGFNFRKGPFASKKFWEENKKSLVQSGILFAVVLVLAFFNVFLDSYYMEKRVSDLNNQITGIFTSTFPDVKKIVDPLQQMRIKIQKSRQAAFLPGETEKQIRVIDILENISKRIPNDTDVAITRLVVGTESVIISGNTDTFNSVDNIKGNLEQVVFFKKIVISSANIDRSDNRVRFKLKVNL